MPIIDVEIVLQQNESLREDLASKIANKLGEIFNSSHGTTWVKTHGLPVAQYAENGMTQIEFFPIFVKVIKSKLGNEKDLQNEAEQITNAVASICGRPPSNVHIIYELEGSGRVAFGGKLVR